MRDQEKETPLMKITAKVVAIFIILVVFLPALIRWLNELLLPFVIIALVVVVARVVWFYTRA
jgi:hypothetical protein